LKIDIVVLICIRAELSKWPPYFSDSESEPLDVIDSDNTRSNVGAGQGQEPSAPPVPQSVSDMHKTPAIEPPSTTSAIPGRAGAHKYSSVIEYVTVYLLDLL
jgi:hypothetical protein